MKKYRINAAISGEDMILEATSKNNPGAYTAENCQSDAEHIYEFIHRLPISTQECLEKKLTSRARL